MSASNDDLDGDGVRSRGVDRRTLIKGAAVAGVAAWTAPMIVDSLSSPAAATTCSISMTEAGTAYKSATGDVSSYTTTGFSSTTSGSVMLAFVASDIDSNTQTLTLSGGPITGSWTALAATGIYTGSDDRLQLWGFWARGNGTSGQTIIVTPTTSHGQGVEVRVFEVKCVVASPTNPIASSNHNAAATGNPNVTFAAPAATKNLQVMVVSNGSAVTTMVSTVSAWGGSFAGVGTDVTQGWTSLGPGATVNMSLGVATHTPASSVGTVTATQSAARPWGTLAVEVSAL